MEIIEKAIDLSVQKIKENNFSDVELICEQILKVEPNKIDVMYMLALSKQKLNKKEESVEIFEKIKSLIPEDSVVHNNVGLAYLHISQHDKATEHFLKAIKLDSKNAAAWCNLACSFKYKKEFKMAIQCLNIACEINKDAQILTNLAGLHAELLEIEKSIELLKEALSINPDYIAAKVDLGCAYHLIGEWNKGWEFYSNRFEYYPHLKEKNKYFPKEKRWDGSFVSGKKILFFSEQGLGDTFNFIKFVFDFQRKYPSNQIELSVPSDLKEIIEEQGFKNNISPIENFDLYCSIMDLPYLLNFNPKEIKESFYPYITTQKKCDFSSFKNVFKIGICWAGNPRHSKDSFRSCYLHNFRKIHNIKNVKLFSLQKDLRNRVWPLEEKQVNLGDNCEDLKIVNMGPFMKTWTDTASIINELDLVISVDTSILHLSAAMGKPTYGLISYLPDWRWGLEDSESFWYPNLKLFRQTSSDDWNSVFNEVHSKLNLFFQKQNQHSCLSCT